ncbi:MAG TPA: hypothetical protein VEG29_00565 [Candidatus Binatia bacterium]|nr:hypothetical protein [Candidatus Binatia bacterium]
MPIGLLLADAAAASGLIALARETRQRWLLVLGLLGAATTMIVVARDGLLPVVFAGPVGTTLALTISVVAFVCWATVLGLPRPVARVLGIGLKSRALTFDDRLRAEERSLRAAIDAALADLDHLDESLGQAEARTDRIQALRPPDVAWAVLRDDIVDGWLRWIELTRDHAPQLHLEAEQGFIDAVYARWREMTNEAALAQRELATPDRQRRGWAVSGAAVGACLMLHGLAITRAYDLQRRGPADPESIAAFVALVGGLLLVLASIASLARRAPRS